ncbi:MAG: hypothetical protein KDM81_04690, partial [Verrucomicrobiae bacterium]|nr:hypothetical protein [Verrucomicrobiae bacterium]
KLYRWSSDAEGIDPTVAFEGDPGMGTVNRWGDTMDARGSGADTQILLASRAGNMFSVLTTADGESFSANAIAVADAAEGDFGLGIAFGQGDTVWATATGRDLKRVSFDLGAGTGTVLDDFAPELIPTTLSSLAYDAPNDFLAGIALETPDNVRLHDVSDPANPVLIDQEFCAADNANVNGTGAADFGADLLAVLDTNNGLVVFDVKKPSAAAPTLSDATLSDGNLTLTISGTAGMAYGLEGSADFSAWEPVDGADGTGPSYTASITLGDTPYRFFRAVQK